jgi:LPXTG-site transpeptidase (sortase) family protein
MQSGLYWFKKARYYSSVTVLYVVTLLFAWYLLNPYGFWSHKTHTLAYSPQPSLPSAEELTSARKVITGKPIRLVLESLNIDLPVDEGNYNESDQTWTLSARHANFAMPSMYANNVRGNTLIYGHYNVYVFMNLNKVSEGALAHVHTDNGHVFTYKFKSSQELKPDDVTVFDYQSYPMLTVQTCSGSFYEYRQMFYFGLWKVDGQDV